MDEWSGVDDITYHGLDFTGIRIHAASRLTRLDVTPDHGDHVTLIIHKSSVEIRSRVRVRARDKGGPTRERILKEVEHGEEVSWRHEHVVTEPAGNDTVMHDGLVGLVLKVRLPPVLEVGSWPPLKFIELLFGRPNLDTSLDAVGCQGTCSLECPFVVDP